MTVLVWVEVLLEVAEDVGVVETVVVADVVALLVAVEVGDVVGVVYSHAVKCPLQKELIIRFKLYVNELHSEVPSENSSRPKPAFYLFLDWS